MIPLSSMSARMYYSPAADASRDGSVLPQILVRLHVEPHREERELAARDQEQRDQDDRRRRDLVPLQPQDHLDRAEQEAGDGHHEPERVEEDERVEVPDHVLLAQPPEEPLHQQPADPGHDAAELDPRLLAYAVDRPRG